jgi:hypothetical protein
VSAEQQHPDEAGSRCTTEMQLQVGRSKGSQSRSAQSKLQQQQQQAACLLLGASLPETWPIVSVRCKPAAACSSSYHKQQSQVACLGALVGRHLILGSRCLAHMVVQACCQQAAALGVWVCVCGGGWGGWGWGCTCECWAQASAVAGGISWAPCGKNPAQRRGGSPHGKSSMLLLG